MHCKLSRPLSAVVANRSAFQLRCECNKLSHSTSRVQAESSDDRREMTDSSLKVLVTHPEVPQEALALLRERCEVAVCQSVPPNITEILEMAKGVHGLYWASHEPLNAAVLDAVGPQLKAITTMSAGIDYVDKAELQRRKIPFGHTPAVLNDAVADLAIGLMIAGARRFAEGRQKIEQSSWENYHLQWMLGQDIRNSTVGFFGFGGIGQTIAKRLSGFDVQRILYTTRRPIADPCIFQVPVCKVPFDELLARSDFLFVAAPLTDDTKGVFNATAFAKMKKNAVFVNVARGQIVNQEDLYETLVNNRIFAAALDVMTPEPLPSDNKLLSLPNCVILPHLGSATLRTRVDMSLVAARNLMNAFDGKSMIYPVN